MSAAADDFLSLASITMHQFSRREFAKLAGSASLVGLAGWVGCAPDQTGPEGLASDSADSDMVPSLAPLNHRAIQLYSLRDVMPADPRGVLQQLAEMGYTHIESYHGPDGICWGMTPQAFRSYCDGLGLTLLSTHADTGAGLEQDLAEAQEAGFQYVINPWIGRQETLDDYRAWADRFNVIGARVREAGLQFAYHNHDYSFVAADDGTLPHDILMMGTDPALVQMQMDVYWVVVAGQDPIAWINRYPGRFTSFHIKDRCLSEDGSAASCDLGTGDISFTALRDALGNVQPAWWIVEQEAYPNGSSLEAARSNVHYLGNYESDNRT